MILRRAERADLPAIVQLLADDKLGVARENGADPLAPCYVTAFDAIAASDASELIVAEQDGGVVGCLQLTIIPGLSLRGTTRGLIEAVRIAAPRRGQGLGAALMRHAIERARARGCGMVQLTTNAQRAEAQRFYRRLGFVASHVGMKLMLEPAATTPRAP